ncbi:hypothetical protein DPMN_143688 [Dreissena polymorpha]|uniref:Reverse transcriptase domain-containing protein n=1 Tax=Dreissena polymorpha TaxID=45954 RepID=A0A9D4JJW8_DREPO|nr:hypothetical protein DPMN_143688 [Dreissena polymorpha]
MDCYAYATVDKFVAIFLTRSKFVKSRYGHPKTTTTDHGSKTKIDDSFPNAQFAVDNYHLWRADGTASGGGVMAYLRSDIDGDRSTLLRVIEDWKRDLDENKYVAIILMDLSKAFDCLPHDLRLLQLEAYGVTDYKIRHPLFPLQRGQVLEFSTVKLQRTIELQLFPKSGQRMEWSELRLFLLFRSYIALFI